MENFLNPRKEAEANTLIIVKMNIMMDKIGEIYDRIEKNMGRILQVEEDMQNIKIREENPDIEITKERITDKKLSIDTI